MINGVSLTFKVEASSMSLTHMLITQAALGKRCKANPANVNPAPTTSHMIAALGLLHDGLALRTVLHFHLLLVLLERRVAAGSEIFVVSTAHAAVLLMTCSTKDSEALRTGMCLRLFGHSVYVAAVWCWAIAELLWSAANVGLEG